MSYLPSEKILETETVGNVTTERVEKTFFEERGGRIVKVIQEVQRVTQREPKAEALAEPEPPTRKPLLKFSKSDSGVGSVGFRAGPRRKLVSRGGNGGGGNGGNTFAAMLSGKN